MFKPSVFLTLFALLCSCNLNDLQFDNIKDITYSPSAAIPLGSASYSIRELIEDLDDDALELSEDSNLFLSVSYRDNSNFQVSTDFVDFGTIQNNVNYNLGLADSPPSPVNTTIPIAPVVFDFDFPEATGGDLIDSLFYADANLRIEVSSSFDSNIDYTVTILETKNVNTNQDFTLTSSVNNSFPDVNQSSLANFKTILDNSGGQNQFQFLLEGTIDVPIGTVSRASDQLDINVVISNIDVSEIYGDFGQTNVDIQDQSINLDGFQDLSSTGLELGDPTITLDVSNQYGIPILLDVSGMTAEDSDGNVIGLSGQVSDDGISINAPTVAGNSAQTIIDISNANSNIDELLNATPIRIDIPIVGSTNPDGPPLPGTNNFLNDQSQIDVMATVNIPLNLKLQGFSTEVDFDISDIDIQDALNMSIRIITENQLPFDAVVNIQILDNLNNVLHEIPDVVLLETPVVGPDGRVSEPQRSVEDITLDQAGIDAFIDGSTIRAQLDVTSFDSQNDTFVNVFSDYSVLFELSFFGEFTTILDIN